MNRKRFLIRLTVGLLLLGFTGCASLRLDNDNKPDGEGLPWNSPASWEGRMPMGAPY